MTGQTYQGGGSITVSAPTNKGQLRVLVKDWKGGKVGEDGKFIYATSAVAHGGAVTFSDPGTTEYYTSEDAQGNPSVTLSHAGGNFRTPTIDITITLNEASASGWYKINNGAQVNLTPGRDEIVTLGADMKFNETATISWLAKGEDGKEYTGSATYKKIDPNAVVVYTIYFENTANWNDIYAYCWNPGPKELLGKWPGTKVTDTEVIDGRTYYRVEIEGADDGVQIIFNNGSGTQTGDLPCTDGDFYTCEGKRIESGVDGIDAADEEVEFFNLQGIRVEQPAPGVYIMRRGGKTSKVVIR